MRATIFSVLLACIALPASAASEADLANKISDPISNLISAPVSSTFVQGVIGHASADATGFISASESTSAWAPRHWTVPPILTLSHVLSLGVQPMSVQLGGKYYAGRPEANSSPGLGFAAVLQFPE